MKTLYTVGTILLFAALAAGYCPVQDSITSCSCNVIEEGISLQCKGPEDADRIPAVVESLESSQNLELVLESLTLQVSESLFRDVSSLHMHNVHLEKIKPNSSFIWSKLSEVIIESSSIADTSLPYFKEAPLLNHLEISKIDIPTIDYEFRENVPDVLTYLDIRKTKTTILESQSLSHLKNLQYFIIVDIPLQKFSRDALPLRMPDLHTFILGNTKIERLEPSFFDGMPKLEVLMLNGNKLTTLDFNLFAPIEYQLTHLLAENGKPMLRQGDTGDWIGTFVGHKGAVWGVALNKDASKAASGSADFEAKLWDSINGGELHSFSHPHIVKSVHFNSDDSKLLTGSNDKKVRIFDLHRPEENGETLVGHTGAVKKALFLHNDKRIVSTADDKSVRFWDLSSLQEFKKIDFDTQPNSLEISHNGNILVITHGHSVSFWDIENYEKIKEYVVPSQVNAASLHPDQSVFVCGGDDFKMYKFDYENGNEIESFKGHFGPVHCVQFSPDGELYASGSEDGTLRLWQTIVGKTYGLWKCVMPGEIGNEVTDIASGDAPTVKTDC